MIHKFKLALVFLAANLICITRVYADLLTDLTQKAILNNPDVLARWHTFNASVEEIRGAKAGYFPRVDVTTNTGKEFKGGVSATAGTMANFNRSSAKVELTQMLWDGFATRDEINRLSHAQLTRHYELLDATETVALDTVRSYNDVLRNQELYALTEENYIYHRTVFEQIQNKVKAGVGRKVDLEQISGRVALSESNLVTDRANVHDVGARFQRVIGIIPPATLPPPASMANLVPLNAYDAHLASGLEANPAILAAIENIRSAQSELDKGKAKYQPRLDLHLSDTRDRNSGGTPGSGNDKVAELTLTWNLFNGGADVSKVKQGFERIDSARGQRDSACRNARQTLEIAYNDVWKLTEQLRFLEQHQLAIEKARAAYQKQFDIGQRSLLDLLDTENELYQAKRSYINGKYDLNIAYARTLAGMGKLVASMGLTHLETPDLPAMQMGGDTPENCPPEGPLLPNIDKEELNQRARDRAKAALEAAALAQAKRDAEAAKAEADAAEAAKFAAEAEAARITQALGKPGSKPVLPSSIPLPVAPLPKGKDEAAKLGAEAAAAAKFAGAATPKPMDEAAKLAAEAEAAAKFAGAKTKPTDDAAKLAAEAAAAARFAGAATAPKDEAAKLAAEAAAAAKFAGAAPKPMDEAAKLAAEAEAAAKFAGAKSKPTDEAVKLAAEAAAAAKFAGAAAKPAAAPQATPTLPAASEAAKPAPAGPITPPEVIIERWMKDWESKNVEAYLAHYDISFVPGNGKSRQEWETERRRRIAEATTLKIRMERLEISQQSPIKVTAVFTEILEVNSKKRSSEKQLELIRDGKDWFIQTEKTLTKRNKSAATSAIIPLAVPATPAVASLPTDPATKPPVLPPTDNNAQPAKPINPEDEMAKLAAQAEINTKFTDKITSAWTLGATAVDHGATNGPQATAPAAPASTPETMIASWLKDWESKNVDAYLKHYDASFTPANGSIKKNWEINRRRSIGEASTLKLDMQNLEVKSQDATQAVVIFTEVMEVNGKQRSSEKQLELVNDGKTWLIKSEKIVPKRSTQPPEANAPVATPEKTAESEKPPVVAETLAATPSNTAGQMTPETEATTTRPAPEAGVKTLAETKPRADEEVRLADQAKLKADEDARHAAEAAKTAEDQASAKRAEDARIAEQVRLKAEMDARAQEEERARMASEAQKAAELAKQEAEAKVAAQAKAEEEARIAAEEKAKTAEQARLKAEAEAKAAEEQAFAAFKSREAEQTRLATEANASAEKEARIAEQARQESEIKAAAEAKALEDAQRKAEIEAKAAAEAKIIEEKAAAEAKARTDEEARLAAEVQKAAELARHEAEAKAAAKIQEEARLKAEAEAKAAEERAFAEFKVKEAEQSRLATEANIRAEIEARAAEQARQIAEAKTAAETRAAEAKARSEEQARLAEQTRLQAEAEAKAKAAEEQAFAEFKAREAEQVRLATEANVRAAAEARTAELARQEAEAKAIAEAKAKAAEEKAAAETKARVEEARLAEQARLKAEAEVQAAEEAKIAEQNRLQAEAEAKKKAEEEARIAEQARVKAEIEARAQEEERARVAAELARQESEAKAVAAAKAKADEEARLVAEAATKRAEEARLVAEAQKAAELAKQEAEAKAALEAKDNEEARIAVEAAKAAEEKAAAETKATEEAVRLPTPAPLEAAAVQIASVEATSQAAAPETMLQQWMRDWESKNVDAYLTHYDAAFVPPNGKSRPAWEAERRRRIGEVQSIKLQMLNLEVSESGAGLATVAFTESIVVNGKKRSSEKQLVLVNDGKNWRIQSERVVPRRTIMKAAPVAIPATEPVQVHTEPSADQVIEEKAFADFKAREAEQTRLATEASIRAEAEARAAELARQEAEIKAATEAKALEDARKAAEAVKAMEEKAEEGTQTLEQSKPVAAPLSEDAAMEAAEKDAATNAAASPAPAEPIPGSATSRIEAP